MDCSTPGLSVPHHLSKFDQVYIHFIGDAIQQSHPLTPSSPSALKLSQHQGLFWWVSCSHQMPKVLEFQLQHQSLQWVSKVDFPEDWLVWYPCCPRDLQEFSLAPHLVSLFVIFNAAIFSDEIFFSSKAFFCIFPIFSVQLPMTFTLWYPKTKRPILVQTLGPSSPEFYCWQYPQSHFVEDLAAHLHDP